MSDRSGGPRCRRVYRPSSYDLAIGFSSSRVRLWTSLVLIEVLKSFYLSIESCCSVSRCCCNLPPYVLFRLFDSAHKLRWRSKLLNVIRPIKSSFINIFRPHNKFLATLRCPTPNREIRRPFEPLIPWRNSSDHRRRDWIRLGYSSPNRCVILILIPSSD